MQEQDFRTRAQTNIQLYAQLAAAGYTAQELGQARDGYVLATKLFAGQLRPEGRPFVCHVVGVASILCMVGAPRPTIVAALLHSAYSHGDYGLGPGQVNDGARIWLRSRVGPHIEGLLASYAANPWTRANVLRLLADPPPPDSDVGLVALIRVADTLEEALDHGLQLSQKTSNPNRDVQAADCARLATLLGYASLGAACRRQLEATDCAPETLALRSDHAGSYTVCPSSWREKASTRTRRLVRQLRSRS